nr:hypothetical protein GCM10020093_006050 [Planobispora longispora]
MGDRRGPHDRPAGVGGVTALRVLRIAAAAEAVSIAVLLANLLTVHAEAVTSAAARCTDSPT